MSIKKFSLEIAKQIAEGIVNKKNLNSVKAALAEKYHLGRIPRNYEILTNLPNKLRTNKILKVLRVKRARSSSGIVVVAIMPKPKKCPGKCIYCPSSLIERETPKSYTGKEPATMRALNFNFSVVKQLKERLKSLELEGHSTDKIEIIIMGGTFFATKASYQRRVMLQLFNAITSRQDTSIKEAKKRAEHSKKRIIGITFETRPDFATKRIISRMLFFGATRCELGVQHPDDEIYRIVNRGHSVKDVVKATALLKDSAFKVCYHMMPGLPGSTIEKDLQAFKRIFNEEEFKPDMLKIYPTLVLPKTELYRLMKQGKYKPLNLEETIELLTKIKRIVPRWVRIMRIQRDIPYGIVAGPIATNLRQLVKERMQEKGIECKCIRCREAGLVNEKLSNKKIKLFVESYEASKGTEFFISFEDKARKILFAYLRLRFPAEPFRKEIDRRTALIREIRVLGRALPLGIHGRGIQHRGLGRKLINFAESLAEKEGYKRMIVISGIGVREYFRKFNYRKIGEYMGKRID